MIYSHKLFSMQLGPGTASLACAKLIVPFAPFTVKVDPCWYKVDDLYFVFCPLELYFCKNKKLLCIKKYKELLEPILDCILPFSTKISKNKTWAEDPQYDSLWKWFNRL